MQKTQMHQQTNFFSPADARAISNAYIGISPLASYTQDSCTVWKAKYLTCRYTNYDVETSPKLLWGMHTNSFWGPANILPPCNRWNFLHQLFTWPLKRPNRVKCFSLENTARVPLVAFRTPQKKITFRSYATWCFNFLVRSLWFTVSGK